MLKKLVLRSLRFHWKDIVIGGSLPNLRVLKLKKCNYVDGIWETTEGEFPQLEFLLIEYCDFDNWITESSHFPRLRRLWLHSCWFLNAIPNDIGEIPTLELIEVNGVVGKSLVKSAKEIQNEQDELGNNTLRVICKRETSHFSEFASYDNKDGENDDDNNNGAEEVSNEDNNDEDVEEPTILI